ncbi:hypothetical protein THIOSC13_750004 [uncultured Thiomicrorhabdus sp.]
MSLSSQIPQFSLGIKIDLNQFNKGEMSEDP